MLRRKGIRRPFQGNDRIKEYLAYERAKKADTAKRGRKEDLPPVPDLPPPREDG